jgi:UDP-glucose:(heptosyl)LPS alpha-1,3-glucosyltransferase
MRIALVIEHFDATRGGAEHLAVWVANDLVRRGHEVHVVCHDVSSRVNRYRQATLRASHDADRSFRAHPPPEVAHDGLFIHRLRGMRMNTALGFRLFGVRARQWCREHRPEVVHSLTVAYAGDIYHAYAGVYAAMQQQAAESRRTEAGSAWKRMMLKLPGKQRTLVTLERRAVAGIGQDAGARRVVSLCGMMTRQFAKFYPGSQKKVTELSTPRMDINGSGPLSEEEEARQRAWFRGNYRIGEKDRVAVFVGHDFRRKGLRYAIEAIARSRTGWKLVVVGLGKAREYVELADELGIGDATPREKGGGRVLFVGPTREMASVYPAADALLLPTFYEPSGLLVLEAFAHGLPVVSTEFLGASELVREHGAGRIVDSPRNVAALAEALDGLPMLGTAAQKQLAARARAASDGPSAERYMEALVSLYESVRRDKAMR